MRSGDHRGRVTAASESAGGSDPQVPWTDRQSTSPGRLDPIGHLLRARRLADLSQRDAAELLGVSKSTLGRWEKGDASPPVDDLMRALALADLALVVVDRDGAAVPPFAAGSVRDNARRRFPAHLDVVPPDCRPGNRGLVPRRDRAPATAWFAHRDTRDRDGGSRVTRPLDHPTAAELAQREVVERQRRLDRNRDLVRPRPSPPACRCPEDCEEYEACPVACPCGCEAGGLGTSRLQ